jgi:hypothetical protein
MAPVLLSSHPLDSRRRTSRSVFTDVGRSRATARRYADAITVGKPGRCPEQPVLTICLFDNSGSVTGGNDPVGQRFLEAYLAISKVGARCRCGKDLAAALHFDTPTSGDLEPTPITKAHHADIQRSLAIPPDGAGASLLGASLTAAQQLAKRYRQSHRIVLAVLSDFLLFDNYLAELVAFPGDVQAVALQAPAPQQLVEAPSVTVTPVDHSSRPGAVARAIFTALTRTRPHARALPVASLLRN